MTRSLVPPFPRSPSLAVEIAGITFTHPVLSPPGPLGFGREVQSVVDLRTFAGFVTKSVTLQPRPGHAYPQIVATDGGWLNSLGLPNHGLAVFLAKDLPFLRTLGIPIIVSIAADSEADFVSLATWLDQEQGVAAIEANISCPNVADGMAFGVSADATARLVASLRRATARPLFVKLTPNVTDVVGIARAAEDAGADALSLINTLLGLAIDVRTRRPKLGAVTGGLSGPAIRPVAVRMVWDVARACRIPLIGMGGIATAADALEFIIAGATAVAVGSAAIDRPTVATDIRAGLDAYLVEHEIGDIRELIGSLQLPVNGES
ncbi:MAG TPA: dihydroorotate dehydrogenase [bacterium]